MDEARKARTRTQTQSRADTKESDLILLEADPDFHIPEQDVVARAEAVVRPVILIRRMFHR